MTDPSRYPDPGRGSDADAAPGMSRWLKVGIILVIVVLVVAVVMLVGGGHTIPTH